MSVSRLEEQQRFCVEQGWGDAELYPLPRDASKRSYTRLIKADKRVMLMDAPPEYENLAAYIRIAGHLKRLGIHTPAIYSYDLAAGFALIEDFGDDTFTRLLDSGVDEKELYRRAVDVLIHIQKSQEAKDVTAPPYDEKLLLLEAERFVDWFVPAVRGDDASAEEKAAYLDAWAKALKPVSDDRSMLVVRDFHVDNLMIVDDRKTLTSCGLLDFQDALIGSPAYDLVSLVEDARRDVADSTRSLVLDLYFSAFPELDRNSFERNMAILGAQRHAKVLGLFTRLSRQDGKHMYLKHIPRVSRLFATCLQQEALSEVRTVVEAMVPGYQDAVIEVQPTSLYPE